MSSNQQQLAHALVENLHTKCAENNVHVVAEAFTVDAQPSSMSAAEMLIKMVSTPKGREMVNTMIQSAVEKVVSHLQVSLDAVQTFAKAYMQAVLQNCAQMTQAAHQSHHHKPDPAPSPAPAPAPAHKHKRSTVPFWIVVGVAGLLLIIVIGLAIHCHNLSSAKSATAYNILPGQGTSAPGRGATLSDMASQRGFPTSANQPGLRAD